MPSCDNDRAEGWLLDDKIIDKSTKNMWENNPSYETQYLNTLRKHAEESKHQGNSLQKNSNDMNSDSLLPNMLRTPIKITPRNLRKSNAEVATSDCDSSLSSCGYKTIKNFQMSKLIFYPKYHQSNSQIINNNELFNSVLNKNHSQNTNHSQLTKENNLIDTYRIEDEKKRKDSSLYHFLDSLPPFTEGLLKSHPKVRLSEANATNRGPESAIPNKYSAVLEFADRPRQLLQMPYSEPAYFFPVSAHPREISHTRKQFQHSPRVNLRSLPVTMDRPRSAVNNWRNRNNPNRLNEREQNYQNSRLVPFPQASPAGVLLLHNSRDTTHPLSQSIPISQTYGVGLANNIHFRTPTRSLPISTNGNMERNLHFSNRFPPYSQHPTSSGASKNYSPSYMGSQIPAKHTVLPYSTRNNAPSQFLPRPSFSTSEMPDSFRSNSYRNIRSQPFLRPSTGFSTPLRQTSNSFARNNPSVPGNLYNAVPVHPVSSTYRKVSTFKPQGNPPFQFEKNRKHLAGFQTSHRYGENLFKQPNFKDIKSVTNANRPFQFEDENKPSAANHGESFYKRESTKKYLHNFPSSSRVPQNEFRETQRWNPSIKAIQPSSIGKVYRPIPVYAPGIVQVSSSFTRPPLQYKKVTD